MNQQPTKVTVLNPNTSAVNMSSKKPADNVLTGCDITDINYETAVSVLLEELENEGVWSRNMRIKVATKILLAKLSLLEQKVDGAIAILTTKEQ